MDAPMNDVDPATAQQMLDDSDVTLIDVREDDEWAAGHAPDAVHVALGNLDPSAFPPENTLVVICRSGARSAKAATKLAAAGLPVHNVVGGMKAWESLGQPVIRNDQTPGTVI